MTLLSDRMLHADRALHADLLESLRRGSAETLYDSPHTILLRERSSGVLFFSGDDRAEAERVLSAIAPGEGLVIRNDRLMEFARDYLGLRHVVPCWQVLYEKDEPLPLCGSLLLRHPSEEDFARVRETYSTESDEALRADFDRDDFLGGYVQGQFVGYIGTHCEGAMGLLEIFPEFRRRGYAQEIYSALINRQLQAGRLPYAQVVEGNEASLALQRKLGLTFSRQRIFWMWR